MVSLFNIMLGGAFEYFNKSNKKKRKVVVSIFLVVRAVPPRSQK
jgi:hypothetical protein